MLGKPRATTAETAEDVGMQESDNEKALGVAA